MNIDNITWDLFHDKVTIDNKTIHVLQVSLEASEDVVNSLWDLLSKAEQQRAKRFQFEQHRRRYIVAHGALRKALSHFISAEPQYVQFISNSDGKPILNDAIHSRRVYFNLSHSHEKALIAISLSEVIGIDIENTNHPIQATEIAKRFFSNNEYLQLMALPEQQRILGFFNCWTRKEAITKATGKGLAQELKNFSVNLAPNVPAAVLEILDEPNTVSDWQLDSFVPATDYVAAVAVNPANKQVKYWTFELK